MAKEPVVVKDHVEIEIRTDLILERLELFRLKLDDPTAVDTDHVVVVSLDSGPFEIFPATIPYRLLNNAAL